MSETVVIIIIIILIIYDMQNYEKYNIFTTDDGDDA